MKNIIRALFNKETVSRHQIENTHSFSDDDRHFMSRALELAKKAESKNEIPVGAVLVLNNKIIGEGFNLSISNNDPSAHAEIVALRNAGEAIGNYRLVDSKLYVTLEPCAMCAMALVHARVDEVIFGAFDYKTGAAGSVFSLINDARHNHVISVKGGLLKEECSQLISGFFKRRRKEKKIQKNLK